METLDTGVIYIVYNVTNGKGYIGQAYSYEKHGVKPPSFYGANGRLRRHISNAFSKNKITATECPFFYADIRKYGKKSFIVHTLKICKKSHLDKYEAQYTKSYKTFDQKHGYNYFVGKGVPQSKPHIEQYKGAKADSNKNRAIGGAMRQSEATKNLPPNINLRVKKNKNGEISSQGYFVQIKINNKLYNRAFMNCHFTMEEKLEMAIKQLEEFKKNA